MQVMFVLKQLGRSLHRSVLWVLLLSMVIGFITVGFGQWYASRENLAYVDNAYTTIVAIDDRDFWRSTAEAWIQLPSGVDSIIIAPGEDLGEEFIETRDKSNPDPYQLILDKVDGMEMVVQIDDRRSSRAYCPEAATVVHPLEDINIATGRERALRAGGIEELVFISKHGDAYNYKEFAEGMSSSCLVGKCVSTEIITPVTGDIDCWWLMEGSRVGQLEYAAIFEIDHSQSPALHPVFRDCKYYRLYSWNICPDFKLPYTVGEDYFLQFSTYPKAYDPDDIYTTGLRAVTEEAQWYLATGSVDNSINPRVKPGSVPFTEEMAAVLGISYHDSGIKWVSVDGAPGIKLEGSVQDFLTTEEGAPRVEWIKHCNRNIHGLTVISTSNLYALPSFNKGDAYIIEGRNISDQEADTGSKVCVISAALARENGLALGDQLSLSFQRTGYTCNSFVSEDYYKPGGFTFHFTEFTESEGYRIIGIYSAPAWDEHYNAFSPNTVFIPLKALPDNIPEYPDYKKGLGALGERAGMFSIVLKHGNEQAFLEQLGDPILAQKIQFFDQGYSRVRPQLETLNRQAGGLLLISALVWVVVMVFFFLLLTRGLRPVLGIMVSLGAERRRLLFFLLSFILILSLCGLAIGGTAGNFAYLRVMNQAYSNIEEGASGFEGRPDPELPEGDAPAVNLIEISPRLPLLIVLAQGLVILLVAVLVTIRESRLSARILLESGGKK